MNVLTELNRTHTYAAIAARIETATGRRYSVGHLGNVARGSKPLNRVLRVHLRLAFPEKFLSAPSGEVENFSHQVEPA